MLAGSTLLAPRRRDLDFQLYEVLDLAGILKLPYFAENDRSTADAIVDAAYELAADYFEPSAAELDAYEFRLQDGALTTPPRLRSALGALVEAGFFGVSFSSEDGGLQLPMLLTTAIGLAFAGSNNSAYAYAQLTTAAAHLLAIFGDGEQRRLWMRPLIEGRYFGTMALSEPQAGSSLGDITMAAEPAADGTYRLRGSKMWISAAEHDLAENIVHLVLAKIPGAPAGVKGISLFIVPKFLVDAGGTIARRNDAWVTGLNHKLGQRGVVNTVLTLGERGECVGYLVGAPHDGMRQMFQMMNESRVNIGANAVALSLAAYEYALRYAKDRPQGRSLSDKNPLGPAVPIVEHPDVRHMLLRQKAIAEGGLALVLYCAALVDEATAAHEKTQREEAELLLDVLTPVAKTWPSERGVESTSLAIQVLGGYGYSPEYPLERHFRDQRLNPIHEGTTGIQALDLLGRKLRLKDGAGLRLLSRRIEAEIAAAREVSGLEEEATHLQAALETLLRVSATLLAAQAELGAERALSGATLFLDAFGSIVVAWRWLAQARRAAGNPSDFAAGKLAACRYFFRHLLADAEVALERLEKLDDYVWDVRPEFL